jgi:hypothetical protein
MWKINPFIAVPVEDLGLGAQTQEILSQWVMGEGQLSQVVNQGGGDNINHINIGTLHTCTLLAQHKGKKSPSCRIVDVSMIEKC